MTDRDRLAADLKDADETVTGNNDWYGKLADHLIALGWTRLDIPTRLDARITEPMLRAAMRSAPNLTPHAIWTRLMNLYDFPPDSLDEERLARALHRAGVRCSPNIPYCRASHRGHAVAIAKAYREDTDATD